MSLDFLKQERVLEQLDRASYDAVVIDEAHHCMDVGGVQDREDSLRRRLAEVLARRLRLPDPGHRHAARRQRPLLRLAVRTARPVAGRWPGELARRCLPALCRPPPENAHRRSGDQADVFKERHVLPIPVKPDPKRHAKFIAMQKGLMELLAPELRRAFHNKSYADVLAFIALLKRSVSTVEACKSTLSVVADRFEGLLKEKVESEEMPPPAPPHPAGIPPQAGTVRHGQHRGRTNERRSWRPRTWPSSLPISNARSAPAPGRPPRCRASWSALEELIESGSRRPAEDPKLDQLVRELVESIRQQEPKANILIYTEYVDSQRAGRCRLKQRWGGTMLTIMRRRR